MTTKAKTCFSAARILVTGHTGFKGSWLALWLMSLGARVTGASIDVPTEPSHFEAARLADGLVDHRLDVRDGAALRKLVEDLQPDYVFHLAAQPLVRRAYTEPVETWQTNTMGTVNMLEALRILHKPCVAVFVTTDKCYENVEWVWGYRETDALGGPEPYGAAKAAAELAIRSYVRSYFSPGGMVRIGVGRAGNVIGGGDWSEDRIVPDCVRAWSCGETVKLRRPGATRPWQHVLESLSGYLALAMDLHDDARLHGEPFNFGPPAQENHTVGALVAAMAQHWDRARWEDISDRVGGPYESGYLKLNCDKAFHHLHWRSIWDFEATVRETALWYRRYYETQGACIAEFTEHQIATYSASARKLGVAWAQ